MIERKEGKKHGWGKEKKKKGVGPGELMQSETNERRQISDILRTFGIKRAN